MRRSRDATDEPSPSAVTYEAATARLEAIIKRLDSGEAGLRETLDLCREGRTLVELCAAELEAVGQGLEELRLDDLVARLEAGAGSAGVLGELSARGGTIPRAVAIEACMRFCMLICMSSTSVRIDTATHRELRELAAQLGSSVGATVALAVRRLRQEQIGAQLKTDLTPAETAWLDADLG